MARTYRAEGRQLAYLLRGFLALLGLVVYYYTSLRNVWWALPVILIVSFFIAEICGALWTRKRRSEKKVSTAKSRNPSTAKTKQLKSASSNRTKLSDLDLMKANVHTLSGTDFERLMELYYKDQGYQVQRVGGSGDHEVDLILKGKEGYKIAVQCKRWKQDVGNDIVLRLKSGKQVHGCYDAWIVTTSNFTKSAREAADKLNIQLINGLMLDDRLKRWKTKRGVS